MLLYVPAQSAPVASPQQLLLYVISMAYDAICNMSICAIGSRGWKTGFLMEDEDIAGTTVSVDGGRSQFQPTRPGVLKR